MKVHVSIPHGQTAKVAEERLARLKALLSPNFPVSDTDRLQSFLEVAQQADRVLSPYLKGSDEYLFRCDF